MIWAHGGGFCCGDKASADMPTLATYFAQRGYVAVSINYRLLAPNGAPGQRRYDRVLQRRAGGPA